MLKNEASRLLGNAGDDMFDAAKSRSNALANQINDFEFANEGADRQGILMHRCAGLGRCTQYHGAIAVGLFSHRVVLSWCSL